MSKSEALEVVHGQEEEPDPRSMGDGLLAPAPPRRVTFLDAPQLADRYRGGLKVTEEEQKQLREAFDVSEEIDILPTGEVYSSHVNYRDRLTEVFGSGQWWLRPADPEHPFALTGTRVTTRQQLFVRGFYIAETIGGADYQPKNDRHNYDDACEAAKSNALVRCCKDSLGIGAECWKRRWTERFKKQFCGAFFVKVRNETKVYWRRLDSQPFKGEAGRADNRKPSAEQIAPAAPPAQEGPTLASDQEKAQVWGEAQLKWPAGRFSKERREKELLSVAKAIVGAKSLKALTGEQARELTKHLRAERTGESQ